VTVDGIKIYGAPWIPSNREGKAFSYKRTNEAVANYHWSKIPNDTDVLITHGPAYNKLDRVMKPVRKDQTKLNLGCPYLANVIKEINPQLHICGHIHSSQGILDISEPTTTHINAASLGEDYQYSNKRRFIEWEILKTTSEIGLQGNGIKLTTGKQEQAN
jgi:Icc-related predicted phosphoesterase